MRVMDNLGPDTSINTLICSYYLHSTLHCLVLNPSNTEKLIQVASMNSKLRGHIQHLFQVPLTQRVNGVWPRVLLLADVVRPAKVVVGLLDHAVRLLLRHASGA